jgi:PAS domain S-box-containing protein
MVEIPGREQIVVQRVDLASVLESSGDAIVGEATSGLISVCNRAAATLYGFTGPELLGKRADSLITPQHRAEEATNRDRVLAGDNVPGYLAQRLCRDGTVVQVSLVLSPILDSAGAVIGLITVARPVRAPEPADDRDPGRADPGTGADPDGAKRDPERDRPTPSGP